MPKLSEVGGEVDACHGAGIGLAQGDQPLFEGKLAEVPVDSALGDEASGGAVDDLLQLRLHGVEILRPQRVGHVQIAFGVEELQLLGCESGHRQYPV